MRLKLPMYVAALCAGAFSLSTSLCAMPVSKTPMGIGKGNVKRSTAEAATLQASALQNFGNVCVNTFSDAQELTITGTDLTTANIQVGPSGDYKFSLTGAAGSYTSSVSISHGGGDVSATVYVVFAPDDTGATSTQIPVLGGGAASIVVNTGGMGVNTAPSVNGTYANALTASSAKMGGTVSSAGCSAITEKGVVYGTSAGVLVNGPGVTKLMHPDTSTGAFSVTATGLFAGTTYFVKAYAINDGGITYGTETSFSTAGLQSPEAIAANYVTSTGFRANWEDAEGAQKYYLDVATSPDFGITSLVVGYNNKEVTGNYLDISGVLTLVNNYYYRVRAYASGFTTGNSNVITIKVPNYWTGSSWSLGTPPAIDERAVINGNYATGTHGNITAYNLTLMAGNVVVNPGTSVTLRNEIVVGNGATFEVMNDGHFIQTDDVTVANSGNVIVHRNSNALYRLDYTMWASPVASTQTIKQFSPQTLSNRFYIYDTAQNIFMNSTNSSFNPETDSFATGKGYLIRTPDNHTAFPTASVWAGTYTGVPLNGDITVPLQNIGQGQRYNLIGNPYASALEIDNFLIDNIDSVTGTIWYWRKTNGAAGSAYVTYSGGTFSNGPGEPYIQPGQGFIVEAMPSASQVTFKNNQRKSVNGNFFRMQQQSIAQAEKHRIWLNLNDANGVVGNMAISYIAGATSAKDPGMDGKDFESSAVALASYVDGEEFSVQGRALPFSDSDIVPLMFRTDAAGSYSIALNAADGVFANGQAIYLRDKFNGTVTNLNDGAYNFTTATGTFTDRFEIVYNTTALDVEQPVADVNNVMVWKQGQDISVNAGSMQVTGLKVYDLNGRMLYNRANLDVNETIIKGLEASQQLLIVEVDTTAGTVSKKVVY